jgi:homocitrate synthase NifV
LGLAPTAPQARAMLARVRALACETKRSPSPDDLRRFLAEAPAN